MRIRRRSNKGSKTEQDVLYHERSETMTESAKQTATTERMTALLQNKLLQVIEAMDRPDAKTLRDCVSVLKDLTTLTRDLTETDEQGTGVILLPCVREGAE